VRLFGGHGRYRDRPSLATGQHEQPVVKATREADALQSLARALMAARLGEALVAQAARGLRMDDLEQVARR